MNHLFKTKAHNLIDLYKGVHTVAQFKNKLEKQSKLDPDRYDSLKYLGDGFEFFIELLLKLHPVDSRIGVSSYSPIQVNDTGVDGVGVNTLGEPCVIQVKYRSNSASLLTANKDHLSNMFSTGDVHHGVTTDRDNPRNYRHFVFTTAKDLHFYTDNEMYGGKVRVCNYNHLRILVDNNIPFWNAAREIVSEYK